MLEQLPNILIWATIWIVSWGIFFWFVHKKNVDYIKYFVLTAAYFLCVAIITSLVFRDHIARALQNFTAIPLIVLGLVILVHIILYIYLPNIFRNQKIILKNIPKDSI